MQLAWIHLAIYLALLYWECTFVGFAVRPRRVHFLLFSLSPSFPLCALNQHKFSFIVFICLFTLISFPFQRLPIRDLQTSEAEWQGSCQVYIWVRMSVCVCVFRDKIKIQMERKHWNHHFSYRQLRGLRLPLLTNSSRVMKQKALKCTHFMTHRISFK